MGYFLFESIVTIVLAALVGAVIGFIIAWLLRSARADAARRSGSQAAGGDGSLQASLDECATAREDLKAQVASLKTDLDTARADLAKRTEERDEAQAAYDKSQVDLATRTAELIGRDDELTKLREAAGVAPPVPPAPADLNKPATVVDLTEDGTLAEPAAGGPAAGGESAAPDDLERIEGIGPKMRGALNKAGLFTFLAVAEASVDDLRAAVEADGLKFAPSIGTWARQARLLADGDEAGFLSLKERLVAGRDVG